ncbi:hypothetical protein AB0C77_27080 [Streptomyces sp. NPDC048629]|uniref:hypothetical protein n=1 Tax=Streptomyces sp. NPDC048629 TaxID=3154824 RepID=UPI00342C51CD
MMPQTTPPWRVCRDCDGFATVTISTGLRSSDGTRDTVPINCRTCRGLGHTAPAALARAGK